MPRRWISTSVAVVAAIALGLVLYNATLVDRRPPTVSRISLSATAGGDDHVAQTLTAIDLAFSEPVDHTSVEQRFRIEPYVGGTFTWDRSTTAIFTPAHKLPSDTAFSVIVAAGFADVAGNAAPDPTGPFEFRTIGPPVVASMTPPGGTTGVPTDTVVQLEFDRLMDTASVETALKVEPAAPHDVSWSGPGLTITFRGALAFGTTYSVTVGRDAADTDGSHLAAPYSGTFTTVAAGLGVDAVVPSDGVAGIGVRTPIAVMFDGPIDPASVDGAIRITPAVGGDVRVIKQPSDVPPPVAPAGGTPSPSAPPGPAGAGTILLFTPSETLAQHTTYTVELAPVVHRADDPGQVAAGRTWTFTTGGLTTSAQNQIAFLSDRGGIRNVWLMNPDGSNPREITTELAPVTAYDVASDGRSIVYAAHGSIRLLRLDGSDPTVVTASGSLEYAPTLAPGGGAVLVGRRDASGADLGWWIEPLPGGTGAPHQIIANGAPPTGSSELGGDGLVPGPGPTPWASRAVFDPTGRWLVLVLPQGQVIHADLAPDAPAPSVHQLDMAAPTGIPAWDAIGADFLLVGSMTGGDGLFRIGADGGGAALVTPAVGPVAVAEGGGVASLVAPSGAHVGYAAAPSGPLAALTSVPDLLDRSPGFSPDGTTLLFARVLAADPTRSDGIWLSGLDGRDLRQLTTDGAAARWLP
jgi:hypothetical protein